MPTLRWLILLLLGNLSLHAQSETVISFTGDLPSGSISLTSRGYAVSWRQTNRFTNVTISVAVSAFGQADQTGTAILSSSLPGPGPSPSIGDEITRTTFAFPLDIRDTILFTGLTLEPINHYLTIKNNGTLGCGWLGGCAARLTCADGVTVGADFSFPPSGLTQRLPSFRRLSVISETNIVTPGPGRVYPTPRSPEMNNAPAALEQTFTTTVNTPLTIVPQTSDPDGDFLELLFPIWPEHGTIALRAIGEIGPDQCVPLEQYVYTPNADFVGTDSFVYQVWDTFDYSWATVTINVVGPPLSISPAGEGLRLSWPSWASGFQLETALTPDSTEWELVGPTPTLEGDRWTVELQSGEVKRFFRLRG